MTVPIVIVDVSGSMVRPIFDVCESHIKQLIERFNEIRLVAFDDIVKDYGTICTLPPKIFRGGITSYKKVLDYIVPVLYENSNNEIYFISDGEEISDPCILSILNDFKEKLSNVEVKINVIGIGEHINTETLRILSGCGSSNGMLEIINVEINYEELPI
mgnify:CR=1 FL=1